MRFDVLFRSLSGAAHETVPPYVVHPDGYVVWDREGGNLEGAPAEIEGSFYCNSHQLQSLEGSPSKVQGHFDCSYNQLESLEGAPEKVEGCFSCHHNPLTSLRGIPEASEYMLPVGFKAKDARKEVERRKFNKGLDPETLNAFGDFVAEL